jgi:transposase
MMPTGARIFVCTEPLDMRKSFDGLALAVREQLGDDPQSGALFLFFNRRVDRVKCIWWDRTGYTILYKRLERGRFRVPQPLHLGANKVQIDPQELPVLLEGVALPPRKRKIRAA